jgi:hypothetical protein
MLQLHVDDDDDDAFSSLSNNRSSGLSHLNPSGIGSAVAASGVRWPVVTRCSWNCLSCFMNPTLGEITLRRSNTYFSAEPSPMRWWNMRKATTIVADRETPARLRSFNSVSESCKEGKSVYKYGPMNENTTRFG